MSEWKRGLKPATTCLFLLLAFTPAALYAQISSVIVTPPRLVLISGEQMQLAALARDAQGNPRNNDRFNFNSSNRGVISVDGSGVVTAGNPGIASITATVQGTTATSPGVLLQVVPLRIDITAGPSEVSVGTTVKFDATALDINKQPLAGVTFRWQVSGANGFNTRAAAIDSDGRLTTSGIGLMTIHAQFVYSGQSSAHVPLFEGLRQILITAPREFKLTRLLQNTTLEGGLALRPSYNSEPATNDLGQTAFTANFDGLGNALMFYDAGKFQMLASTGTPGPLGGYIWHFDGPPAINNNGDVVVRFGSSSSWGLMRASKDGDLSFLLENGTAEGLGRMSYFRVGRSSINDQGDIVFLADFQFVGSTVWHTGLFLINDQTFRIVWSNTDALPTFPADFVFDNSMFGVDRNGAVYFRVFSGRLSAIYRIDGMSDPLKIAGTGTTLPGGTQIQDVQNLALSPNGTVAFNITAGTQAGVVRLRSGSQNLQYLSQRSVGFVLSVNDNGETLYSGDPGAEPFWGVYVWRDTPAQLFPFYSYVALEGGEKPTWARTGKITSRGESYLSLDSAENHLLMTYMTTGNPRTLWRAGTVLNVSPNLNFQGLVPGSLTGASHTFGGGGNASLLEVTGSGIRTIWAPGDRPVGLTSTNFTHASKSPSGDLYLTFYDGILHIASGRLEAVARFPFDDVVHVTVRGPNGWYDGNNSFSANSNGAFVFNARTDTDNRLELYNRGAFTPIIIQGGQNQTASPAGGKFSGIFGTSMRQNAVLIDEGGRVLANALVTGGPSGLFLYETGQWKAVALYGQTTIDDETVNNARGIRVAGNTFYALFDMTNGDTLLAQYNGQNWVTVASKGDIMPDGTEANFFYNSFAVNRRGEIVYAVNANGEKLVFRTADGVNHLLYSEMSLTDDGSRLPNQTFEFDIRDDGTVYFAGFDVNDRNTIYKALRK